MFVIRPAEKRDSARIARIVNSAFDVERPVRISDRTSVENVRELMQRGRFFVAETKYLSRIVGTVFVKVTDRTGYFGMLAVDPSLQGSGIGRALREHAEAFCKRQGCTQMTLSTGDFRTELLPYYRKAGYKITGREPAPPEWPASRPFQIVHMSKRL
jgi:predicted N-acetyltransferase YhbS